MDRLRVPRFRAVLKTGLISEVDSQHLFQFQVEGPAGVVRSCRIIVGVRQFSPHGARSDVLGALVDVDLRVQIIDPPKLVLVVELLDVFHLFDDCVRVSQLVRDRRAEIAFEEGRPRDVPHGPIRVSFHSVVEAWASRIRREFKFADPRRQRFLSGGILHTTG